MWREQQMTRSFMALVFLVLAGGVPGQPQFPTETPAGQASIIFVGRVMRVAAASVREVKASPRTLVMRVTAVVAKPKSVALKPGDEVTVEVKEPSAFAEGDSATFYAEPWVFAKGLAVREVRHEMEAGRLRAKAVEKKRQKVATNARQIEDPQLTARIQAADLVLVGQVTSVRPAAMTEAREGRPSRVTEHDPNWQEAVIQVQSAIKGVQANQQNVVLRFPGSLDVAWRGAPKFKVGQQGTFILRRDQLTGAPRATLAGAEVDTFVTTNAQDVLPAKEEKRIRALAQQ